MPAKRRKYGGINSSEELTMRWIVAVLVLGSVAHAQEGRFSQREITAWSSVQEELTACTAVWHFAKTCAPENASEDELKRADEIITHFTDLALSVGSNIGMSQDAMLSRFKMAVENQARITGGKCINNASLMARYLTRCKLIAENPQAAFREYMAK